MHNKITVYAFTGFLTSFAFGSILPVYVLYFRHYQINLFQIGLLAAIFEASILIFEIPTGLVADIYGRKLSVILSTFVSLVSGILFIFFPYLLGFIIAEILNGLGETLRSGALEAWLVDSLKYEGKEEKTKYAFAQGTKYRTLGNLSGLILGGYLASLNMKLVWIPFALIFFILSIFLILNMKEEYKIERTIPDKIFSEISEMIKNNLRRGKRGFPLWVGPLCFFCQTKAGLTPFGTVHKSDLFWGKVKSLLNGDLGHGQGICDQEEKF